MKLFSNNIVPYTSTEGDKIYPIVVDIKKGIKSGEAISFVTADNQVGVITVEFMDGNSSYSIEGCMVTSTIRRPDGTVLEIPCDIISQSIIEIPLGINGTYQEGVHTFDLKIVRGNGKVIGVPTMSYSVSGSLSSDDVVEGDDRLPVLTMVLDNAQDKLTRLDKAIAGATNDLEVKEARDGEVTLNARLERDLAKGKIHFVDVEGSNVSTESEEGYLENVEIHGNTWQNAENLADIRSVGTKVEGQELYEIPVLSYGKNLFDGSILSKADNSFDFSVPVHICEGKYRISFTSNVSYSGNSVYLKAVNPSYSRFLGTVTNYNGRVSGNLTINADDMNVIKSSTKGLRFSIYRGDGISDIPTDILITQSDDLSYEPYQEDKLIILSPTPLEKVGDVADRIVCKDGVYGVEKNVGSVILNGTENWAKGDNTGTATHFNTVDAYDVVQNSYRNLLNSKYHTTHSFTEDKELFTVTGSSRFIIKVLNSKIPNSTVSEFTNLLKNEPVLVKYQTTQPTFIPLPHDQQVKLRTFANRTNISFLTEIEGTIKAQVPKSLGATVNTHTTQIDNLNKELARVKKLEESTVSTVTTDKAFTTIVETTQGYFEDVKLEGKTLVNLAGSVNDHFNQFAVVTRTCMLLKCNTEYTAVISNKAHHLVRVYGNEGSIVATPTFDIPAETTIIKKLHTKDVVDDTGLFKSNSTTGTLFKLDILLLEGDHTDKDLSYFEGLKSVGQDVEEVNIKSINKNLIDINIDNWEKGSINNNTGENANTETRIRMKHFGRLPQNVNYLSFKYFGEYKLAIRFYDMNFKGIDCSNTNYSAFVVTSKIEIPNNAVYYRLVCAKNSEELIEPSEIASCMCCVELNDVAIMSYIEPKQDRKQILYYKPTTQTWEKPVLREWDSIEKHSDGKYYYHKRSEEVVFNGSEEWYSVSTLENVTGFGVGIVLHGVTDLSKVLSDRFSFVGDDKLGQIRLGNSGKSIFIYIDKSKLSTQDVAGFKKWLQANPTTVVYQLTKEEVYECTNLDLITHNGETNLIVNSGAIQPRIELKVLSNVSNVVKLLQEKVSILENKFIEGLKQVLAGDMYSLAQLLYPEDFEHEIQTLEL